MTQTFTYATIGEISNGTLRTQDLLETFSGELKKHLRANFAVMDFAVAESCFQLIHEVARILPDAVTIDATGAFECTDEAIELVNQLSDTLDIFAPPYTYFGANEGSGSCFGFWPNGDVDEVLTKYSDLSESPVGLFETLGDAFNRKDWNEVAETARKLDWLDGDHAELFSQDFLVVNDHGNMSVYRADGTLIWSIV